LRALITGGAGFIGSHLTEQLLELGHSASIIDDLSTGNIRNIQSLKGHKGFEYVIDTVANERLLAELVDGADVIFHLSAAVGVRLVVESPVRTMETNIRGTELVLRMAAKKRKRVLITSTSEVYGKREDVPFRETDDLVLGSSDKGRWSYACSKAIDEFMALAYYREKSVPAIIVRLFNTVGPRQTGRYGMVLPSFVQRALKGEDLLVHGDGTQRRCFAHVADVVNALIRLTETEAAVGQIFNLGTQEEVTINELAERIVQRTHSKSKIRLVPYREAYPDGFEDMHRRIPDLTKIDRTIGYRPQIDLNRIIESVITYYEEQTSSSSMLPRDSFSRTTD
jgi:UDP-glucose 4-epimerase